MNKTAITVTEAARHFADYVNRVHTRNESFVLLKKGKPVASLIPQTEKICTGKDLAKALERVELTPKEARAWQKDLAHARKALKSSRSKWGRKV